MNPLAITAAPVQGGASELTAPCMFYLIVTFLSYNNYNYSYFPMARDGAHINDIMNVNVKKHLLFFFNTIKDG